MPVNCSLAAPLFPTLKLFVPADDKKKPLPSVKFVALLIIGVPLLFSMATAPFPSVIDLALESITTSVDFAIDVDPIVQPAAFNSLLIKEKFSPTKNTGLVDALTKNKLG